MPDGAMESFLSGDLDRTVPRHVFTRHTRVQFSLQDTMERDASLYHDPLFFGLRLEKNTFFYFDPEIGWRKRIQRRGRACELLKR